MRRRRSGAVIDFGMGAFPGAVVTSVRGAIIPVITIFDRAGGDALAVFTDLFHIGWRIEIGRCDSILYLDEANHEF